jgi:hypothetical protein
MVEKPAPRVATTDLLVRLAAILDADDSPPHRGVPEPEAAAERLVHHLADTAANDDLRGLVDFFSNGLGLARAELRRESRTRRSPVEVPSAERDSSYWLG